MTRVYYAGFSACSFDFPFFFLILLLIEHERERARARARERDRHTLHIIEHERERQREMHRHTLHRVWSHYDSPLSALQPIGSWVLAYVPDVPQAGEARGLHCNHSHQWNPALPESHTTSVPALPLHFYKHYS